MFEEGSKVDFKPSEENPGRALSQKERVRIRGHVG